MKNLQTLFLCGCLCWVSTLQAQTFFANPGPLYTQQVALNQANLCFIHFDNPSGDSLLLRWRKLEASMPQGWDADICDYGTCYIDIPNTALMHWVHDTMQPYLKLIVQPGAIDGAAWFWFRVSEEGNTGNFVDVYYSLHTSGVSSVQTPDEQSFVVYPNPSSGPVFVENKTGSATMVYLSDPTGRLIGQQRLEPDTASRVLIDPLVPGVYFLRMNGKIRKGLCSKIGELAQPVVYLLSQCKSSVPHEKSHYFFILLSFSYRVDWSGYQSKSAHCTVFNAIGNHDNVFAFWRK